MRLIKRLVLLLIALAALPGCVGPAGSSPGNGTSTAPLSSQPESLANATMANATNWSDVFSWVAAYAVEGTGPQGIVVSSQNWWTVDVFANTTNLDVNASWTCSS